MSALTVAKALERVATAQVKDPRILFSTAQLAREAREPHTQIDMDASSSAKPKRFLLAICPLMRRPR